MQVKFPIGHPLAGMMTAQFICACIGVAFSNLCETEFDGDLDDALALATVDGLIWG